MEHHRRIAELHIWHGVKNRDFLERACKVQQEFATGIMRLDSAGRNAGPLWLLIWTSLHLGHRSNLLSFERCEDNKISSFLMFIQLHFGTRWRKTIARIQYLLGLKNQIWPVWKDWLTYIIAFWIWNEFILRDVTKQALARYVLGYMAQNVPMIACIKPSIHLNLFHSSQLTVYKS